VRSLLPSTKTSADDAVLGGDVWSEERADTGDEGDCACYSSCHVYVSYVVAAAPAVVTFAVVKGRARLITSAGDVIKRDRYVRR
jgi:hypothetical protein